MTDAHQQQRYRVLERLASGGMAEVFIAESAGIEGFKKQVAIKRVLPHLSEKKRFIAMFLDEARLSAYLSHSKIAQVFDIGVGDNAYFIVMEYVDGADLKGVIEYLKKNGRGFPTEAAVYIASEICEGLAYAHDLVGPTGQPLKIVHRDMSPPNVLITKYGEVKIVDFGLAKATSQLEKSEAGIIKGKFSYLAPEAALGQEVDHRADIFAVGIILWEMLAGRRLFLGESDYQTVKLVQQAQIPALSAINRDVPPELDTILARALAREPARRYGSARELGRDLVSFLYRFGRPVTAYDVSELVRGAMTLRKRAQPDKASIIDKLIEEALLEFTSLQGDRAAPSTAKLDEPLKLADFEDIGKWADEIHLGTSTASDTARRSLPAAAFEEGNLAALEDDDGPLASPSPATPTPSPGATSSKPAPASKGAASASRAAPIARTPAAGSGATPAAAQVAAFAPKSDSLVAPAPSSGGATKVLLLVAALAAVLVVGAWFGGLIPH